RVVGGIDVLRGTGAWAGIVSIQANWSPRWASHVCGGTLITPYWVLTAAHCFINRTNPLSEWAVLAGATVTTDLGGGVQIRRIKRVRMHKDYAEDVLFDIAVVELEKPIACSPTIQLACLPDPSMTVALQTCYIAGWGHTYAKAQVPAGVVLQEAKVPIISNDICNRSDWNAGFVQEYNVCAGYPEGGVATCQGDSGGPLVCKDATSDFFWQIGITSWGIGCARPKKPGVSVSTQYFYNWIVEQI
ncbi:ACRO protein, partial [Campylorhamphus procurvoides]|nr:ACRO protein [Campylorhamphus procurvoides]